MISIQTFQPSDLEFGLALSTEAGWNQTADDWRRFLTLSPHGCFVARVGLQRVGTVTTCQLGGVGWIGMMLVEPAWRRQGIGQALMRQALDHLSESGCPSVRLDATQYGAPLYTRLGFSEQFKLHRYAGCVKPCQPATLSHAPRAEDMVALVSLDRRIIGYDREPLLQALWQTEGGDCAVGRYGESLAGYAMRRPGRCAVLLGPCVADSVATGRELLQHMLTQCSGHPVFVDVPDDNDVAIATVTYAGLQPVREFRRMVLGHARLERVSRLFASSGPETG